MSAYCICEQVLRISSVENDQLLLFLLQIVAVVNNACNLFIIRSVLYNLRLVVSDLEIMSMTTSMNVS